MEKAGGDAIGIGTESGGLGRGEEENQIPDEEKRWAELMEVDAGKADEGISRGRRGLGAAR